MQAQDSLVTFYDIAKVFSIQIPYHWEAKDASFADKAVVKLQSPLLANKKIENDKSFATISSEPTEKSTKTLTQVVDKLVKEIGSQKNLKVLEAKRLPQKYTITYLQKENGETQKVRLVAWIYNGRLCVFTFGAPPDTFKNYIERMDAIEASLRLRVKATI
jgi:hypothetical protein